MNNHRKEQQTKKIAFIGKSPGKRKEQVVAPQNNQSPTIKIDEDVFLIKWERFKIKAHNRMIFNLSELELLFRVWLQLTTGDKIT